MMFVKPVAFVLGLIAVGPALAQTVTITGLDGASRVITAADLAAMPHRDALLVSEHGPARHYQGTPLTDLLTSVGAPTGAALRGKALGDIVVISGSDGYRVVLALSDTDPGVRGQKVLLADRVDGAPLPAQEGPFRLVVEGDLRPARSVRMVTGIRVVAAP